MHGINQDDISGSGASGLVIVSQTILKKQIFKFVSPQGVLQELW